MPAHQLSNLLEVPPAERDFTVISNDGTITLNRAALFRGCNRFGSELYQARCTGIRLIFIWGTLSFRAAPLHADKDTRY